MSITEAHGIPIEKPEEIYAYLEKVIPLSEEKESEFGKLLYYEDPSGINTWMNLENTDIKDYYFGYNTGNVRDVVLTESHKNYENKDNSVFTCDAPGQCEYRIAVLMNNYKLLPKFELPVNAKIKLYGVAFQDIDIYQDKNEFDAVKNKEPMKDREGKSIFWGDKFISPSGLMAAENERFEISDTWMIARVLDVNVKINTVTDTEFLVARCNTVGGEIDTLFSNYYKGKINKNSIIDGIFVLRGEVLKTWETSEEIKEMFRE